MADGSHIEWTDATANVVNGCSVVSPGCTNCYAMRLAASRLRNHPSRAGLTTMTKAGAVWTGEVRFHEPALLQVLRWRRPRKIFWNAHGDLFHPKVPDEWIDRCFAVMAMAPQHIHQVLTKRSARMCGYVGDPATPGRVWAEVARIVDRWERGELNAPLPAVGGEALLPALAAHGALWGGEQPWPLRNIWLGVSAEDQPRADERIPDLLATPAARRFVSAEPLLGPIELETWWLRRPTECESCDADGRGGRSLKYCPPGACPQDEGIGRLNWVIAGGESGPGARPMHPDWVRSLRDQCGAAGVAFFMKQWGEWFPDETCPAGDRTRDHRLGWPPMARLGKHAAGRLLDGVQHNAMPEVRP